MTMNDDLDMISFEIIADAGDARRFAAKAWTTALDGEFEQARSLLEDSRAAFEKAHRKQTDLLFSEMNGSNKKVSILLLHSQDQLMNAQTVLELVKDMIDMLEKQNKLEKRVEELERGRLE